ncbi:hypothetical protein ACFYW8_26125 [Streptomyces sp. NPDC002742]|uniref:hypothetical protein n=1 Tax=Streptomyces sp. NPDC002742 TaxID=3364663 RepID=UPI0036CDDFDB
MEMVYGFDLIGRTLTAGTSRSHAVSAYFLDGSGQIFVAGDHPEADSRPVRGVGIL